MDLKTRIDEVKAQIEELEKTYDYEKIDPNKDMQKLANLGFAILKSESKMRALSFLNGVDTFQIRSTPQYKFLCPVCGQNASFRVKELVRACKLAHTESRTHRHVPAYLCTFAADKKGILRPEDKDFTAVVEEFKKYEQEIVKN